MRKEEKAVSKKRKITAKEVVLGIPFLGAFIWLVSLIANTSSAKENLQLSPGRFDALVIVLFIFIVIYGILLFYIFRSIRREEGIEKEMERKIGRIRAESAAIVKGASRKGKSRSASRKKGKKPKRKRK